jgi:hypothetical protein
MEFTFCLDTEFSFCLDTEFSTQFTALFGGLVNGAEVCMMGTPSLPGKDVNGLTNIAEHFGRCDVYRRPSEFGACDGC